MKRIAIIAIALLASCDPCRDLAAAAFEELNVRCVDGDQAACEYLATHTYGNALAECPAV